MIGDHVDPVADEHLAAGEVAFDGAFPSVAAVDGDLLAFAEGGDHGLVGRSILAYEAEPVSIRDSMRLMACVPRTVWR